MDVIEEPDPLDAVDAESGDLRVCASACSTCIFNREDDPDRYPIADADRDAWAARVAAEDGYVVCHDSGIHRPAGMQAAVCHGFWIRYHTASLTCVLHEQHYRARKVPPPHLPAYPNRNDTAPDAQLLPA